MRVGFSANVAAKEKPLVDWEAGKKKTVSSTEVTKRYASTPACLDESGQSPS